APFQRSPGDFLFRILDCTACPIGLPSHGPALGKAGPGAALQTAPVFDVEQPWRPAGYKSQKEEGTMTKHIDFGWLVFGCAFDWVVTALLYHSLFFRCLPGMNFSESGMVLAAMAVAMILAGALVFGVLMGKNDER